MNAFALSAAGAAPQQFGLFCYGREAAQFPLGNGFGCVGTGGLWYSRFLPPELTDAAGAASLDVDLTSAPAGAGPGRIEPGSTWFFQYRYRDPAAGGAAFNLSDGLRETFQP